MKKRTKYKSLSISHVKIYLDDLREIYNYLKEISDKVTIETDEASFENIDELTEIKGKIKSISLIAISPYISVVIERDVNIYTSDDSTVVVGTVEKIRRLLAIKRKLFGRAFSYTSKIPTIFFGFMVLSYILFNIFKKHAAGIVFGYTYVVTLLCCFIILFGTLAYKSTILLYNKNDMKGFWVRNKDTIFVGLLVSIISTLIGIFIGRLLA